MQARSHLIFGIGATWLVHRTGWAASVHAWPLTLVGALLPDIDHPKSMLGRRVAPVSLLVSGLFGHRGMTHSLLLPILAVVGCLYGWGHVPAWMLALAAGYLSHLLADWLTPSGVPLCWPLRTRFRSPLSVTTGSAAEWCVAAALAFAMWRWW